MKSVVGFGCIEKSDFISVKWTDVIPNELKGALYKTSVISVPLYQDLHK